VGDPEIFQYLELVLEQNISGQHGYPQLVGEELQAVDDLDALGEQVDVPYDVLGKTEKSDIHRREDIKDVVADITVVDSQRDVVR